MLASKKYTYRCVCVCVYVRIEDKKCERKVIITIAVKTWQSRSIRHEYAPFFSSLVYKRHEYAPFPMLLCPFFLWTRLVRHNELLIVSMADVSLFSLIFSFLTSFILKCNTHTSVISVRELAKRITLTRPDLCNLR